MKRFLFSLCFVAFLSAGLVSCNDQADDVTPMQPNVSGETLMDTGVNPGETSSTKKPG